MSGANPLSLYPTQVVGSRSKTLRKTNQYFFRRGLGHDARHPPIEVAPNAPSSSLARGWVPGAAFLLEFAGGHPIGLAQGTYPQLQSTISRRFF